MVIVFMFLPRCIELFNVFTGIVSQAGCGACHDAARVFVALAKPNDDLVGISVYPLHLSDLVVTLLVIDLVGAYYINP
jgi:hypothetical protein